MTKNLVDQIKITFDKDQIDLNQVHTFLKESYWSKNISKDTVQKAIENSLAIALKLDHQLVGFGRLITDYATFAYLADVFVIEQYRGLGLSKTIVQQLLDHVESQNLRRILLATRDAHELYRKFGFKDLSVPSSFLEINRPNIYKAYS
jgi:N-acetylglutamate synthase-like GNAT family acetyltransferase